ncbi:MAG: SDR family oxidoreductase [Chloroflexi bacterium]|jgi:3-oxoacyl-[acyl-carrier protein] reductase|nr:SDR family NAD(P)-dependent oxidoreductase [Anaerolineaceae bacterium]NMB91204.1 SDR family oxidoreductase [Chloroflexota bacterium]
MELGLAHKTVLVTGGASGLGAAIGAAFVREGSNLVVFDRAGAQSAPGSETGGLFVQGDVTRSEDIEQALVAAREKFGGVDVLVNNAGIWPSTRVVDMPDDEWQRTLLVNLTGAFLFSKRFVRDLLAEKRPGVVVNIVSPVAYQGSSNGHSHYAASKAGLVSFTRSLALEVAGDGVRVVAVAPGVMHTQMTAATLDDRGESYRKRIPIGRFVTPQEVANVVVFMSSGLASSVTGTTIDATGGMLGF